MRTTSNCPLLVGNFPGSSATEFESSAEFAEGSESRPTIDFLNCAIHSRRRTLLLKAVDNATYEKTDLTLTGLLMEGLSGAQAIATVLLGSIG